METGLYATFVSLSVYKCVKRRLHAAFNKPQAAAAAAAAAAVLI